MRKRLRWNGSSWNFIGSADAVSLNFVNALTVVYGKAQALPVTNTTTWSMVTAYLTPNAIGTTETFYIPVILPEGAQITGWTARLYRASTSDAASAYMGKVDNVGNITPLGSTISHTTTGYQTLTQSVSETVAATTQYLLGIALKNNGTSGAGFLLATVTYTRHDLTETL